MNATFHEDLTGKVASAQGSVSLHEMDVKLKFPDFNPGYFKPGLPFEVMVSRQDSRRLRSAEILYQNYTSYCLHFILISLLRGTHREYSSKVLKHSIVERILVFKR